MGKIKCPNCQKEIADNIKFCPKCGEKLEKKDVKEEKVEEVKKDKNEEAKEVKENKIEKVVVEEQKEENTKETSSVKEEVKEDDTPTAKKKKNNILLMIIIIVVFALAGSLVTMFIFNRENKSDNTKVEDKNDVNQDQKNDNKKNDSKQDDNKTDTKLVFVGNTYEFSEGLAWFMDSNYVYLLDDDGKVVNKFPGKNIDGYFDFQKSNFKSDYAMIGKSLYDEKGNKVKFKDNYSEISYADEGQVIVTAKEESYKGTVIKKGIYDLDFEEYILEPTEEIYSITSLENEMYLLYYSDDNKYVVYNANLNKKFDIGDRFDVLTGTYENGYIVYQDINSPLVYLMDEEGNKTLVASDKRHVNIGEYSEGLVFIDEAFYDEKGTKVIDLEGEGVSNIPKFVNDYALIFFDTGYFTILNKETKKYMFEPKQYTSMGNTYNGTFALGLYEDQKYISDSGCLIVRTYDSSTKTKKWAIMNEEGEIIYTMPESVLVNTVIADNDYIGVTDSVKRESYYVSINGKKLTITE